MNRKQIFRIGIVVIFIATLQSPVSYLTFGKIEKGKVVETIYEHSGFSIIPFSTYPKIEYKFKNKKYTIVGEENQVFLVGDEVKVIFYKWRPQKAKVYTFWGLFIDTFIQLPIGLLIWWALFKSYPNLFNPPSEPQWFDNLIKKKQVHHKRNNRTH
jgi:hypothetical protein